MSILSFLRKKQEESKEKHELTDMDREFSVQRRKINAELRRTKQDIEIARAKLQLQELNNQLEEYALDDEVEEEEDNSDSLLSGMLALLKGQPNQQTPIQSQPSQSIQKIELSQEQIENLYKENKKYVKFAKGMTDEQIKAFVSNRMPDLSDNSLNMIVARVRR